MNRSSASPQVSAVVISLLPVIEKTPSSAGVRKITRTSRRVQRHRKIRTLIAQRPFSNLFLRDAIDDRDGVGIWHVDKDLAGIRIDLEAFGVPLHRDVADLAAGRRINDGQRAALPYPTKIRAAGTSMRMLLARRDR